MLGSGQQFWRLSRAAGLLTSHDPTPHRPPSLATCHHTSSRYEFTTTNGLHVAMSAAAQRGNVYVCGVSAPTSSWEAAKDAAAKVVRSFRIKNAP